MLSRFLKLFLGAMVVMLLLGMLCPRLSYGTSMGPWGLKASAADVADLAVATQTSKFSCVWGT